jgi:hypothetical protein
MRLLSSLLDSFVDASIHPSATDVGMQTATVEAEEEAKRKDRE